MSKKPKPTFVIDYFEDKPEGDLIDGTADFIEGVEAGMEFKSYDDLVAEMRELSKPHFA